ncbi:MAG: hypothetical protein WC603_03645 [Candidatus Paceibacterota bacterium]|jgi:hypothetical protein
MKKNILIGTLILVGMFMFSSVGAVTTLDANGDPVVSVNQVCSDNSMKDVTGIVNWASCFLYKVIVPFLFALATVAFIWGVIQFYLNPENEEKRKKGKAFIIGGLIALFVMLSIWGLVGILTGTFQLSNTVPQLPGQ